MILNTYAVLLVFVSALQLAAGLITLRLAVPAFEAAVGPADPEAREALQNRTYLLCLLALLLLGLNLASWPLLYLLLQSYVPQWPGVMCIYGVTRVGSASHGMARHLPDLVAVLQWTKPVLVFVGGAWFVIYRLNQRTATGPLLGRTLLLLIPLGMLTAADAVATLAYVGIPKKEEYPSAGCCTSAGNAAHGLQPDELVGEDARPWLTAAHIATTTVLVVGVAALTGVRRRVPGRFTLLAAALTALVGVGVGGLFLREVAAPTLLGLPFHHCVYDLLPAVPEAVVAAVLYLVGAFLLGWACLARWYGSTAETDGVLPGFVGGLLRWSLVAYTASSIMTALELALA